MINKWFVIRIFLFLIINSVIFAQGSAPKHTRVLFSHPLTSEGTTEIGTLKNLNGTFTATGWQAGPEGYKDCSLRLSLFDYLPAAGSIEITVKNFNPYTQSSQDKHHILSLTSQDSVAERLFYNGGSWCYMRFGKLFNTPPDKAGIKFDTGSTGKSERYEPYILTDKVWNITATYTFKIVWDHDYIWLLLNGSEVHSQPFRGQIQRFRYIYINDDDNYKGMFGPVYSNLKISTEETWPIFADKTISAQLSGSSQYGGYGMTTADWNKDGLWDFYVGNRRIEKCLADILFMQRTGGIFSDEAPARGVEDRCGSYAVVAADFDNDGDLDIFNANNEAANKLYINDGNGNFNDESDSRGIEKNVATTVGAIALDIDKDGDLDIFALNHGVPNEMYVNDGTGRFQRQDRGANGGTEDVNVFLRQGVTAADVDNDGDIDIYVCRFQRSSSPAPNFLYMNNGKGNFTEEGMARGVAMDGRSNGATFADFDNDGDMDLFVSNSQMEGRAQILGVFVNDGSGRFTERSTQFNIANDGLSPLLFDVDNDGDLDLYLVQSNVKSITNHNTLFLNANGNFTFAGHCGADVIAAKARGASVGDIDRDGDLDIYLASEESANIFLTNKTQTSNNYVQIITVGPKGDLGAYGAKIDVYAAGYIGQPAYLLGHREMVSNYGYLCQDMTYAHFGLGTRTACDVRITYTDGSRLERTNLAANQMVRLTAPYRLAIVDGDNQIANPGELAPKSLQVKVTDFNGVGLGGIPVNFSIVQGTGTISESQPRITDGNGQTFVSFRLGPLVPEYVVQAQCPQVQQGSPARFHIFASGNTPARLEKIGGDNQTGVTTYSLKDSIIVRVMNANNLGVANYPVQFEITQGGGKLNGGSTKIEKATNANGYAAVQWTLGTVQGNANQLQVTCLNASAHLSGSPMIFKATGTSHTAMSLAKVSGDGQTGPVNEQLPAPVVVEARDAFQVVKPNAPVVFKIIQGGGRVNGASSVQVNSDANGQASALWTLGTAIGVNKLQANSSQDTSTVVIFSANSESGPGRNLSSDGATQFNSTAGQRLAQPFVVKITDEFGNNVPNHTVLFRVLTGAGNFDGQPEKSILSDSQGFAKIFYTAGPLVGQNRVEAVAEGLIGSPITFIVTTVAGNAAGIVPVSGNNQADVMQATLADPLVARVTDSFNNPIANYPVRFEVTVGGGNIGGAKSVERQTDAFGLASVTATLGASRGDNLFQATASYGGAPLIGSPVIFHAFAKTEPRTLVKLSGDNQTGVISQSLTDSLKVQVLDSNDLPVPRHRVQFRVLMGGGNFNGLAELDVYTDWNGVASAVPVLGPQVGRDRHKLQVRSFDSVGKQLQNSPIDFTASARVSQARAMAILSGAGQIGRALSPLPQPLRAQIIDDQGQPVANHNVTFIITAGGGTLDNAGKRELVKATESDGTVQVTLTLGAAIGENNNIVKIQSDDGIQPLLNSPLYFSASASSGAIDLLASGISASSPAIADGTSMAQITVNLKDKNGNPVRDVTVQLTASGSNNTLTQSAAQTDLNGALTGYLTSTKAERKTVRANLPVDGIWLPDSAVIDFVAGNPVAMRMVSGNRQTANIGTVLPQPLVVDLKDVYGNPVANHPVNFIPLSGDSRLTGLNPMLTDAQGLARAEVIVSSIPGTNYFDVSVSGLGSMPTKFEATVVNQPPANLSIASGNQQIACLGRQFEKPIEAQVTDAQGRPVNKIPVRFLVEAGGCSLIGDNPDTTNAYGLAQIIVHAGGTDQGHVVKAWVTGVAAVVRYTLTTAACGNMVLEIVSGNNQIADAGTGVPQPVVVRVTNENRQPMENVFVTFRAETPGGQVVSPQPVTTDANGLASARLLLGAEPGNYLFFAEIVGQDTRIPILATANRPLFQRMDLFSGNNQSGPPLTQLAEPLAVRITDQDGRAVLKQEVTFQVTQGGGTFAETMPVYSDSQGIARAHWNLGAIGQQSAQARANGLHGSPIEFQATLSNNYAPVLSIPVDTTIFEMQELSFKVRGHDPDGDPIFFGARNLPYGAHFDSTGFQYFTWRPSYTQAGEYLVQFYAQDGRGARNYANCLIHVQNLNRPPQILSYSPASLRMIANYGQPLAFKMTGVDPDADNVNFLWKVNRLTAGYQNSFDFMPNPSLPATVQVTGMAYDQRDTVSINWEVLISSTAIELANFAVVEHDRDGVLLQWETSREIQNLGFFILRGRAQDGPYTRLNAELIPTHGAGSYSFHDITVQAGLTYFYKLTDVSLNGQLTDHGPVSIRVALPTKTIVHPNYPNPFNPSTTIRFELPQHELVKLEVFNLSGQKVRQLLAEEMVGGYHHCTWDGRDETGSLLSSGIYYLRFQAGSFVQTSRLLLLK